MRFAGLETGHIVVPFRRRNLLHFDPVLDLRSPPLAHGHAENQRLLAVSGEFHVLPVIEAHSLELMSLSVNRVTLH